MKYNQLSLASPRSAHSLMLQMMGTKPGQILDVGCSTGLMAGRLTERGNSVVGIEMDPDRARLAERFCRRVINADVSSGNVFEQLGEAFDVIIFGDVLEHLLNPEDVLRRCKVCLKPGGFVIASIPNIANYRVRIGLLMGRFRYEDEGLLDRTHVRFFTQATALEMVSAAGFRVVERRFSAYRLPRVLLEALPGLFAVQFVLKATPSGIDDCAA
ncbi:MAG: class I SAM-dependent methyltransferase [Candidatus Eisenbacteria bacterium]